MNKVKDTCSPNKFLQTYQNYNTIIKTFVWFKVRKHGYNNLRLQSSPHWGNSSVWHHYFIMCLILFKHVTYGISIFLLSQMIQCNIH